MQARLVFALASLCIALPAAEQVVLKSGFRLRAERHVAQGAETHLYTESGVISLPTAEIEAIEREDAPPRPTVAAPVEVGPASDHVPAPPDARTLLNEAADRTGLPRELVHSVAAVESGGRQEAVSRKGALGLMQLMPGTARELGANPHDPRENAQAGAQYLANLLVKYQEKDYQVETALAAYNAGPGAVERYKGIPPYRETREYIQKVLKQYHKRQAAKKKQ